MSEMVVKLKQEVCSNKDTKYIQNSALRTEKRN